MSETAEPAHDSRRRFLRVLIGLTGASAAGSLLQACAPSAPSPTAAPAKPADPPKAGGESTKPAESKPAEPAKPAEPPKAGAASAASPAAEPAASPAAQAAPGASKPTSGTLKLGVLLPYTKVYAALGESITNGMQLYFDEKGGAAGGRRVEMIKEDEEADPQVGVRKVRKLVEQDQVDLLTGVVSSAVALALWDYVEQQKLVFIISNAGANDLTRSRKSPYIFRTSFSNWQPNYPMGEWVYKTHARRVVLVGADYAAGKENVGGFKEGFTAAGGQVLAEVWPPFQNTDYAPFLPQIAEKKPEAVYCFFAGADAAKFVQQFDEFGLKKEIKLIGSGFLLEPDVLPAQKQAARGGLGGLHYADTLDTPENKAFVAAYKGKFNKNPDVYAVQGYDTARLIVEALAKSNGNTADRQALIKAMEGLKFVSPRGPFEVDAETHNPIQNIYAREVREAQGGLTNFVVATFPSIKDPGK